MLDESLCLRENPRLLALLSHYAQLATEDRAIWRGRVMQLDEVEPKELSTLHGELMAFDWIEQNTGQAISACYRVTLNGLREFRRFHGVEIEEQHSQTVEKSQPRFSRKKKQKAEAPETPATPTLEDSLATLEAA